MSSGSFVFKICLAFRFTPRRLDFHAYSRKSWAGFVIVRTLDQSKYWGPTSNNKFRRQYFFFSLLPLLWKIKGDLCDHSAVCVPMCTFLTIFIRSLMRWPYNLYVCLCVSSHNFFAFNLVPFVSNESPSQDTLVLFLIRNKYSLFPILGEKISQLNLRIYFCFVETPGSQSRSLALKSDPY